MKFYQDPYLFHETVDVLNDNYCERTIPPGLKHKPKVLCIAFNFTYRTSFKSASSYESINLDQNMQLKLMERSENWYITGTGKISQNTNDKIDH